MAKSAGSFIFNAVRGGAVGTSEALPGISGGTVALIVGLYDQLIGGAGHMVSGIKRYVTDVPRGRGKDRANEQFRQVDWSVLVPALIGMAVALVLAVVLLAPLVEEYAQYAYALFFGLVLACLWIPYTGAGKKWRAWHYLVALAAAALAFSLTGMPGANLPTNPVFVFLGGAVAICALVLPGVSGSFVLLTLGLYEPTLQAVREVDVVYLGVMALGMVTGLALFVKLLQFLLENHHHITLVVLTGLMAGSLRALWPWQDHDRNPLPLTDVPVTVAFTVVGFLVVAAAIVYEHRKRAQMEAGDEPEPTRVH
jgi:putative membrane protein